MVEDSKEAAEMALLEASAVNRDAKAAVYNKNWEINAKESNKDLTIEDTLINNNKEEAMVEGSRTRTKDNSSNNRDVSLFKAALEIIMLTDAGWTKEEDTTILIMTIDSRSKATEVLRDKCNNSRDKEETTNFKEDNADSE